MKTLILVSIFSIQSIAASMDCRVLVSGKVRSWKFVLSQINSQGDFTKIEQDFDKLVDGGADIRLKSSEFSENHDSLEVFFEFDYQPSYISVKKYDKTNYLGRVVIGKREPTSISCVL